MKKILVILLVAITASATSFAQFRIGPKLGANIGKIDGKGFDEQYKLGYHLGVFAEIPLGKKFGIQPEILWNQINSDTVSGFKSIYTELQNQDIKNPQLNYLSIPLLLSYKPSKFLSLQAGPQYGILLNNSKSFVENGKEAFKNGDFSLLMGVQVKILSARVYGRYAIGLSDINDISDQNKWKTTGFQLGVGIGL
ncbi:PorT family protein [Lacibacter luteus]|uniref:PorT family protein n=1 Tax=Lacibacter luteus TaxID=2508719 RepID=A0A4Q1CP40_9BACT|nr:porin family protein [Lacibacter luteus]RXK62399.1 PorT family protein [Lacibacter luteus]